MSNLRLHFAKVGRVVSSSLTNTPNLIIELVEPKGQWPFKEDQALAGTTLTKRRTYPDSIDDRSPHQAVLFPEQGCIRTEAPLVVLPRLSSG